MSCVICMISCSSLTYPHPHSHPHPHLHTIHAHTHLPPVVSHVPLPFPSSISHLAPVNSDAHTYTCSVGHRRFFLPFFNFHLRYTILVHHQQHRTEGHNPIPIPMQCHAIQHSTLPSSPIAIGSHATLDADRGRGRIRSFCLQYFFGLAS